MSSLEYHSRSVDLFIVAKSVGKVSESFDELARRTRHKISLPWICADRADDAVVRGRDQTRLRGEPHPHIHFPSAPGGGRTALLK